MFNPPEEKSYSYLDQLLALGLSKDVALKVIAIFNSFSEMNKLLKEVEDDIWKYWNSGFWIVIPTNGSVKKNNAAVMGKGLALQAKMKFPRLSFELARRLKIYGNCVFVFTDFRIITFPVKKRWQDKASLELIEKSCKELLEIFKYNLSGIPTPIYIPKVGCGNGKLNWKNVKPILEKHLDSRFIICDLCDFKRESE